MDCAFKDVETLPLVKYYIEQAGIIDVFRKHLDHKYKTDVPVSQALGVLMLNLLCSSKPLYAIEHWLAKYTDPKAEETKNASKYNDDRLGRSLDALYKADRQSMLAEISSQVIKVHELDTTGIHNDSTSISFAGAYEEESEGTVQLARGHNKDGRSADKQIVFGLNITQDGGVPLSFQLYNGNQNDDTTHQPNWDSLREFLGSSDFIYIADCKLCSLENLSHIHKHGGKFITIIPSCVNEHKDMVKKIIGGEKEIHWTDSYVGENQRKASDPNIFRVSEGEKHRDGYRIIWVHGSSKAKTQKDLRNKRIKTAEENLRKIKQGLNKRNLRDKSSIEKKIRSITRNVSDLVDVNLSEEKTLVKQHKGRGRPSKDKEPESVNELTIYQIDWTWNERNIKDAERADGLYPLVTNTDLEPVEVLKQYKKQPHLEKRFYEQKSVLEVAPVFLKNPRRIEAVLFLYFLALMIMGLVQRKLRLEMHKRKIEALRVLPSRMKSKAPTWKSIRWFFENIHLMIWRKEGLITDSVTKGIGPLHREIISLLGLPETYYDDLKEGWWNFQ